MHEAEHKGIGDPYIFLTVIIIAAVGSFLLAISFDASEKLHQVMDYLEMYEVDELFVALLVLLVGLLLFFLHQKRYSHQEILELKRQNKRLEEMNQILASQVQEFKSRLPAENVSS